MTKREHWSSRLGFMLAAAGSAIGLGTMWMLPYVVGQNGGGAFILIFLAFLILLGIPLFIAELVLGRQSQKSVVLAFSTFRPEQPSWQMVGWLGVLCTYLVAGWYSVVSGWAFHYLLMSLTDGFQGKSIHEIGAVFDSFQKAGDLKVFWQFLFLGASATIVYQGVAKGIERYSKILTSALFVLLLLLTAYSMTLSGFEQGLAYILYPDWAEVTPNAMLKALTMALFTLSLGEGIMVTYGSYMQKGDDLPKTALLVGFSIVVISILTALMIFPMVFTLGLEPSSGEGLVFKTLPYVFEQLPGSLILASVFFVLLFFAALTSSIGQLEVIVSNSVDLYGWSRQKATLVAFGVVFCVGLPTALANSQMEIFANWPAVFKHTFLETNYIIIDWMLAIFSICIALYVGFLMPESERQKGFTAGSTLIKFYPLWRFLIRYIVPCGIALIILQRVGLF